MVAAVAGSRFVSLIAEKGHHVTSYEWTEDGYRSDEGTPLHWRDLSGIGALTP